VSEPGRNLGRVFTILGLMSESHSMTPLLDALDEDVVWQGLLPELACRGRQQVRSVVGSARGGRFPVLARVEAEEVGDRVVVTIMGPDLGPGPEGTVLERDGGPRTFVLSFGDEKIVRMESYASRPEAFSALATEPAASAEVAS
jgi:hypothetical protein